MKAIFGKSTSKDVRKNPEFKNLPEDLKESLITGQKMNKKFKTVQKFVQLGIEAETNKDVNAAIKNYEKSIELRFDGSHPYYSLSSIYRNLGKYNDEIRVLETAIDVFKNDVNKGRGDRIPKLEKFNKRLLEVKKIIQT